MASALGFGAIRVHSALNQPLDATINLVALSPEEKAALDVRMASVDMFQRFGIERSALADRIRVTTADGDSASQVRVRLTTASPVREPFLRFLIEADTGAGRALREYTVLLDPPVRAPAAPATSSPPATSQAVPQTTARTSTPQAAPPASPRATPSSSAVDPTADEYGPVQSGETLSRIANRVRRTNTTLAQMQVAIYRNNPQAFSDNMNVLLRGAMLAIPPAERIRAIDSAAARAAVREQRQQAATQIVADAQNAESRTLANASAPPATTDARLRLEAPRVIGGDGSGGGVVGTAGFGRLLVPDFPAKTQADGANADGEASDVASAENEDTSATGGATVAEPIAGADGVTDADPMVSSGNGDAATRDVADLSANTGAEPQIAEPDTETDSTVEFETPEAAADTANTTDGVAASDDASSSMIEPAVPAADSDEAYQPLPSENQDVAYTGDASGLLQPRNLLLLGAGLLLLVALLIWNRRRQYKPVPLNFEAENEPAHGAPVDSEEFLAPVYTDAASEPLPGDEALAPALRVQEADRQIKLGLFDDARAGLEEGLRVYPSDIALQDKRLELDYVAGDSESFSQNVARFGEPLRESGVRWAGVATMGRVLLPQDPRFSFGTRRTDETPAPIDGPASDSGSPDSAESIIAQFESGLEDKQSTDDTVALAGDYDADRFFSLEEDEPETSDAPSRDTLEGWDLPEGTLDDKPKGSRDPGADDLGGDGGFEWQDQAIDTGGEREREHDRGEDPGMAFDLDTSSADIQDESDKPSHIEPIDTSEFDLGDDSEPKGEGEDSADPVEVRLDLARMYIEMEDYSAARELLEEAINDGSDEQRATAQELLNSL
ncbi:FimV N-terminal domain-containing protein [Salinisphaera dokdonensis CL-ES53]|uniref:FimV N-terminal domain-containing protein n=1 Tax=Salinisphaera dokdonensis CL-ES53 TaxID=1304272 RepID=A0ABV2AVN7_9GAMM